MSEKLLMPRNQTTDINMYYCGMEVCNPGHAYGPAIRDHFLIHYIFEGQGIFRVGKATYHLGKNQGFLICPNVLTYYEADRTNPWTYSWVGFHGTKAKGYLERARLTQDNPIFTFEEESSLQPLFLEILQACEQTSAKEVRLTGLLYLLLSELISNAECDDSARPPESRKHFYVGKAISFVHTNYSREISVNEIASYVGLDRSYLSSIFKEVTKLSPQQFLIQFRMEKACELMENPLLSISDISRSVGYNDPLTFSKTFSKVKGRSPRKYRQDLLEAQKPETRRP